MALLLPIFFYAILLLFSSSSSSTTALGRKPDEYGTFLGNVTTRFNDNVELLLAALVSNSSTSMYHNVTVGDGTSDGAYGQYTCWGEDASIPDCHSCVQDAVVFMQGEQPRSSYVWFDICSVRFSNEKFFGNLSASYISRTEWWGSNSTASDYAMMMGFLSKLVGEAARRPSPMFANGENMTMRGVVQCTGDLSSVLCERCLRSGVEAIGKVRDGMGKDLTKYYTESCSIRFNRTTVSSTTGPSGFAPSPEGNASLPPVNAPPLPWSGAPRLLPVPIAWGAWVGVVSVLMLL